MATYTRAEATWQNDEVGGTEIDATALNTIEAGIDAVYKLPNAAGELVYGSAADTLERLAAGTATQLLHGGTTPSWSQIVSANITDGTIVAGDINASANIALTQLAAAAWTTFTPTLTGAGGNPTMGAGATVEGRYVKVGRNITARVAIIFGTTPANPTGLWQIALPEVAQANTRIAGTGFVYDDSPGTTYMVGARMVSTSLVNLFYHGGDRFTGTTPFTVAVNDAIHLILDYETAA